MNNDPFRQLVLNADDPQVKEDELSDLAAAAAACAENSLAGYSGLAESVVVNITEIIVDLYKTGKA